LRRPKRISANTRFFLIWLLAGILETPLLALMLGWPLDVPVEWGVLMHVFCAIFVFLGPPPEKGYFKRTRHWGAPLSVITLFLPGIGWALSGWVVMSNSNSPYDKDAYTFEEESIGDGNPVAALGSPESIKREMADALDVMPAVDALLSDVPGLKRGAIETLSRIQTEEAISWIQKARSETDPEVRFYATTALTRLKHEFDISILAAEREVYQNPGDIKPQLALQRIRYEYAMSGMLDVDGKLSLLTECREKLLPQADRSIDSARLLYLIERVLEPERAFSALDRLEKAMPERRRRWVQERAELLFDQGRFAEIRTLLREYSESAAAQKASEEEDREWHSAILWWTND
jgi:hypothetical protein